MSGKRQITIDTDCEGIKLDEPVTIQISDIADIVYSFGQDLKGYDLEPGFGEDEVHGDIRLQVLDGSWEYHTGDSQYDTDHRGMWGSTSVPAGVSKRQARQIAIDLIEDVG